MIWIYPEVQNEIGFKNYLRVLDTYWLEIISVPIIWIMASIPFHYVLTRVFATPRKAQMILGGVYYMLQGFLVMAAFVEVLDSFPLLKQDPNYAMYSNMNTFVRVLMYILHLFPVTRFYVALGKGAFTVLMAKGMTCITSLIVHFTSTLKHRHHDII